MSDFDAEGSLERDVLFELAGGFDSLESGELYVNELFVQDGELCVRKVSLQDFVSDD